jgi:menaquinone-dependent protoporphyrinogen IX oxidase
VQAVVIYESLTGHTKKAGEAIAARLRANGIGCEAFPTTHIDYEALREADLVVLGSWTDGLVLVGQRPGRLGRLRKLPSLSGKRAVVYLLYAIDPGKALTKLSQAAKALGADVLGGQTIRRDKAEEGVDEFVDKLLAVLDEAPSA